MTKKTYNIKNKKAFIATRIKAGEIGGSVITHKKSEAARMNGKKGGRPRKARKARKVAAILSRYVDSAI